MKKIFKSVACWVWFAVTIILVAVLIVASVLATGLYRPILQTAIGMPKPIMREGVEPIYESDYDSKQQVKEAGEELNKQIAGEGMVLLLNEGGLPIATPQSKNIQAASQSPKVSVFGKNSVNLVYGGSGSGGGSGEKAMTLAESLEASGFDVNDTLTEFYQSTGESRPVSMSLGEGSSSSPTLPTYELAQSQYTSEVKASYREYSDAAFVVISRIGGESFDLPRSQDTSSGGLEGRHYLQLDANEEALLIDVTNRFDKVIVLLNTLTPFQCDFIEQLNNTSANKRIDAVLWVGGTGTTGIAAVGEIANGNINPSGRTVDVYAKDFTKDPTWQNFGDNSQVNGGKVSGSFLSGSSDSGHNMVIYDEGIYVGYRYYETRGYEELAADPSSTWYKDNVLFPFGYGLSYTTFNQSMTLSGSLENAESSITISVTVTNIGDYAGKDAVELYVTLPYKENGIEKSHVQLVDFAKTDILEARTGSQTVEFTVSAYDLASYDYNDANGNGFNGYELDPGDYVFYVSSDSHVDENAYDSATVTLGTNVQFASDPDTEEHNAVVNRYTYDEDDADGIAMLDSAEYRLDTNSVGGKQRRGMSRTDFEGTFPRPTSNEERQLLADEADALNSVEHNNTQIEKVEQAPAHSQASDITLRDLLDENGRVDYNASDWEELLDKLTPQEMLDLVNQGAFQTAAIESIGKNLTMESDGPIGFVNFINATSYRDNVVFSSEILIGSTWNKDLAYQMGRIIGETGVWGYQVATFLPYSGWYAPAVNIHRSPFSGRNFEYYSEDPVLSGKLAVNVINGAATKGVYCDLKHFAVNDQETNRQGLATYLTEQAMREIYLKPFEIAVKGKDVVSSSAKEDGLTQYIGTRGVMSSFNRIGTRWTGGDYRLMTEILRGEWGFEGLVISDYKTQNFMDARQMLYAGNDLILVSQTNLMWTDFDENSAQDLTIVRQAAKNILYVVANSNSMNVDIVGYNMEWWMTVLIVVDCVVPVGLAVWGFFVIRKALGKNKKGNKENS